MDVRTRTIIRTDDFDLDFRLMILQRRTANRAARSSASLAVTFGDPSRWINWVHMTVTVQCRGLPSRPKALKRQSDRLGFVGGGRCTSLPPMGTLNIFHSGCGKFGDVPVAALPGCRQPGYRRDRQGARRSAERRSAHLRSRSEAEDQLDVRLGVNLEFSKRFQLAIDVGADFDGGYLVVIGSTNRLR